MGGQEIPHELCPPVRTQHVSYNGKAWQKKAFDIAVNQPRVNLHPVRFDSTWTRVCSGIANMRCEFELEALEFRKRRQHCAGRRDGSG